MNAFSKDMDEDKSAVEKSEIQKVKEYILEKTRSVKVIFFSLTHFIRRFKIVSFSSFKQLV